MKFRRALVGIAVAAAWLPVGVPPDVACAAGAPRAVLVVDTGADELRFCVALGSHSVSGIELIKLAGEQHRLDYALGHGGGAVCRLAGVGVDGGDCFEKYPDFWGYWRGDGAGGWTWSSAGAMSTTVEDGDVEGWSWGRGDSGSTHPQPPATNFDDVCAQPAKRPPQKTPPRAQNTGTRESSESSAEAEVQPSPIPSSEDLPEDGDGKGRATTTRRPKKQERISAAPVEPTAAGSPSPRAAPLSAPAGADGPPRSGLAALGMTIVLAASGVLVAYRRRRQASR